MDIPADLRALLVALVREAVRLAVADVLVDALPEVVRRAALTEFLSRKEVCVLTGWSDRHLSYLQSEGRLAHHKRGRAVRFRAADVLRFMDEARVAAKGEGRLSPPQAAALRRAVRAIDRP